MYDQLWKALIAGCFSSWHSNYGFHFAVPNIKDVSSCSLIDFHYIVIWLRCQHVNFPSVRKAMTLSKMTGINLFMDLHSVIDKVHLFPLLASISKTALMMMTTIPRVNDIWAATLVTTGCQQKHNSQPKNLKITHCMWQLDQDKLRLSQNKCPHFVTKLAGDRMFPERMEAIQQPSRLQATVIHTTSWLLWRNKPSRMQKWIIAYHPYQDFKQWKDILGSRIMDFTSTKIAGLD